MKQIAVVGLGLIGGSMAWALRGFEDYEVVGVVRREETAQYALEHGICDRVVLDGDEVLPEADVTFLCMNPTGILDYMKAKKDLFHPGALVTDVCGIKTAIMEGAKVLPDSVDFIGCHPMAGRESSGIEHCEKEMFHGAHFLLTPRETSTPEHVALMERIGSYIGCRDVVKTTPENHDNIIAYTSQIMHIMAVSICDDPLLFKCGGFEGNSFRDVTRVAALDVELWTELFHLNAPALCRIIDRLETTLRQYRQAIEFEDTERLQERLIYDSDRKRRMNEQYPLMLLK
ncbi:MAG: prephenate dehydrogenase/arogenate dehydrogenase family protein [Oscillospiraceae bacterium]|nr:prephenate dehydrogenase/arogenate dehydrogenase family protein [Oscillospiraceae bacterium]